jgi:phage repressor protein C with HTH and peptisase S24 domain
MRVKAPTVGIVLPASKTIAANIAILSQDGEQLSQPDIAKRMGMSPKTFWTMKEGAGNPQLENIEKAAKFFKRPLWHLLVENGHTLPRDFDPFLPPKADVPDGHVRIAVLDASPSAGPGAQPVDYAAVLGHIDVAQAWATKRLGAGLADVRALPVSGDSMQPTINDGDLAFVDTSCKRFDGEGIYVLVFNDTLLIKRLTADFPTKKLRVRSDNERHGEHLAREDELSICGRVKAWLAVKAG